MTHAETPATRSAQSGQAMPSEATLSPLRRQCLKDAAQSLGADEAMTRDFAESGAIVLGGFPVLVLPGGPGAERWLAAMLAPRPAGVPDAVWIDALLLANGQAMLGHDWSFGLEDNGDGVLLTPLPADLLDADLLAARLDGMAALCEAVRGGVAAASDAAFASTGAPGEGAHA